MEGGRGILEGCETAVFVEVGLGINVGGGLELLFAERQVPEKLTWKDRTEVYGLIA